MLNLMSRRTALNLSPSTANTAVTSAVAAETTMATVNIGAGQLVGKSLNVVVSNTNANTLATVRTWRVKLGGTTLSQWTQTGSGAIYSVQLSIADRGNNTQRAAWHGTLNCTISANAYTASITTTAATTLTITAEQASVAGSETTTLEFYYAELVG